VHLRHDTVLLSNWFVTSGDNRVVAKHCEQITQSQGIISQKNTCIYTLLQKAKTHKGLLCVCSAQLCQ
jgi:hypothetical protein